MAYFKLLAFLANNVEHEFIFSLENFSGSVTNSKIMEVTNKSGYLEVIAERREKTS